MDWHADVANTWDSRELDILKERLVYTTPIVVFNEYMARYALNKSNVPRPGPISTLWKLRSERKRANDLSPNENTDFLLEMEKHLPLEVFNYDRPNLFEVR